MTSLAFIMGVVPLVTSTGAGAEMRHAMGIAVFSGMLGVTFFGLLLTPLFYVLVRKLSRRPLTRAADERGVQTPGLQAPARRNAAPAADPPRYRHEQARFASLPDRSRSPRAPWVRTIVRPRRSRRSSTNAAAPRSSHGRPRRNGGRNSPTPSSMRSSVARWRQIWICEMAYDRVKAARAVFVESKLDYAPHVRLDAGYSNSDEQQPGFGTQRYKAPSDSLGFDASWEIDLFGRVRRSVEAARADLGAERADYEDAQVTVAAEVARNYFELRGAQKRLEVARRNLDSERQTLELTRAARSGRARLGARRAAQPRALRKRPKRPFHPWRRRSGNRATGWRCCWDSGRARSTRS